MLDIRHSLSLLTICFLTACNGSSGKNDEVIPPDPDAPISITLNLLDENCLAVAAPSFKAGETVCVQALLNKNGEPVNASSVSFSTPLGTLRQSSKLSDINGVAQIFLDSDLANVGAATLSATSQSITASTDYEFINNESVGSQLPQLAVAMFKDGNANNRFKQGETVKVQVKLTNADNDPLENEIVSFSAELGALSANTGLTDQQGLTTIELAAAVDNTIGAASLTATYNPDTTGGVTQRFNYQILDRDVIDQPQIQAGYFDSNNTFIPNQIGLTLAKQPDNSVQLSAGGTLGLKVALVDENGQRLSNPTAISFSSNCVTNAQANIDQQVLTINGEASATYEDISCAGSQGNQDQIIATINGNGDTLTLTQTINLQAEDLGAIEFIAAEPESIVLKGTGGQGKQEISTLSFLVKGALGNPLAQQEVTFALDSDLGGLKLSPMTAYTNSKGEVGTKVTAGNVPTVVRVTASAKTSSDALIQTQSDLLSVNTGLADQNSITLATEVINPEADNINGVEVPITAWLADSFNNPVPDGTTVNFTTEGGQITPSCTTTNGSCTATWRSAEPKVYNHRITILATAIGHETFFDTNGNNVFDDADGEPILNNQVASGFGRAQYQSSGFIDMPEAWRDDNENLVRDPGELFLDFERDSLIDQDDSNYTPQDGKFNGPQCTSTLKCGATISRSINVRKAIKMIMASSHSLWSLYDTTVTNPLISNYSGENAVGISSAIPRNTTRTFQLYFSDSALQTMPLGTSVSINTSKGSISGTTSFVVGNTLGTNLAISHAQLDANISFKDANNNALFGGNILQFAIENDLLATEPATETIVSFSITAPSGIVSSGLINIPLL
ncbi:Ig-like domain-containing protein [Pseudoalteromonas ulvae]|uniref:Big-1 domain-containing protein n=1 Tax=Pseudoalteromonas ulvae TaxID=107327 RepID=A0A244CPI3_PSEDV|nr:Ig-like domain-containing protein [Pseudoalteromonas ulvae]OUL57531.1 hypothetical protein B1199_10705 [Pseudoalteromonas ulvae]